VQLLTCYTFVQLLTCYAFVQLLICYTFVQLLTCYEFVQILTCYTFVQLLTCYTFVQLLTCYAFVQLLTCYTFVQLLTCYIIHVVSFFISKTIGYFCQSVYIYFVTKIQLWKDSCNSVTAALPHRQPASVTKSCDSCHTQTLSNSVSLP
jgi:hypothetical protein